MKLLVGSIFIDSSPIQQSWLELQLKFLRATTSDFEHVALVSEGKATDTFAAQTQVVFPKDTNKYGSLAHEQGLNQLLDMFKASGEEYTHFLFLDSDAFPIKMSWMATLLRDMKPQASAAASGASYNIATRSGRTYDIAVALRSENLETRLHASILFAKRSALEHLSFTYGKFGTDLTCEVEADIFVTKYQTELRDKAYPLIRTNQYNVHPLACGIYYDMFYHHCCGSGRPFHLRASDRYLNRIVKPLNDVSIYTKRLMEDPDKFVSLLAGWNPMRYGKVAYNESSS